jgi:hypothetical protein
VSVCVRASIVPTATLLSSPLGLQTGAIDKAIGAAKGQCAVASTLHTQHTASREEGLAHAEMRKCEAHVAHMQAELEMADTGDI